MQPLSMLYAGITDISNNQRPFLSGTVIPKYHCLIRKRKLAHSTQSSTVEVQKPDADDANDTQAAKKTGATGNTQVSKERVGKQNTAAGQSAAEEVVGGKQTSRIHGVAEGNVHKDTLHDHEDGGAIDGDADGGHDPVDRRASGPGEEEETDRRAKGSAKGGNQTLLLGTEAVLDDARVHVEVQVAEVANDTNEARDQDAQENETNLAEAHVVINGVNQREDLKDYSSR